MAHYAHINSENIVDQVIVADQDFIDSGIAGPPEMWLQTSYNTHAGVHLDPETRLPDGGKPFRKNYAGPGYIYDVDRDAFIPPKPDGEYILNEDTCLWEVVEQPE